MQVPQHQLSPWTSLHVFWTAIWHPVELKLENLDDRSAGYNITCVHWLPYWYLISRDFGKTVFPRVLFSWFYCAFHKHANSEVKMPTDNSVFCCSQSSWRTSQETKLYFNRLKVMVCDLWLVDFDCEGSFWTLEFTCLWKAQ